MSAKNRASTKAMPSELLAARLAREAAQADPAVQAQAKEQSFLRAAQTAQDDLIWLINNEAWSALGFDTFADWWDARVSPVLNELPMLRPTREVAQLVIDRVRAEDEARPKSQRRTSKQLAAMVGLSAPTVRRSSSRSLPRSGDAESDLEETPPVIDVEPTNVTDEPTTEPAPADVPDAMTQAITDVAGSVGAGVRLPAEFLRDALCGSPVDPTHCDACGTPISWPDQTGGHLRCLTCDPSSDHKAIPNGPDWLPECSYCATQTSAAVTAGNTEDASPALGEPDVDELAASTSGTPSSEENSSDGEDAQPRVDPVGSEPGYDGLGSGELQDGIEEEAVEGSDVDLSSFDAAYLSADDLAALDSPAADTSDTESQVVLQQSGPDSPTGREGDRSETNHHTSAGVSDVGVAPEVRASVEPVLEGGGLAPDPPSSSDPEPHPGDRLLHALGVLVHLIDEIDPEALGPYLFPGEVELLHLHADRIAEFVGRVGLARRQLAGNP